MYTNRTEMKYEHYTSEQLADATDFAMQMQDSQHDTGTHTIKIMHV